MILFYSYFSGFVETIFHFSNASNARTVEAAPEKKIKISESAAASAPSAATTASSDVSCPIFVCGSCGQREQYLSR